MPISANPPPWFRDTQADWNALSLGARLNLAFDHVYQTHRIHSKEWWENREFFFKVWAGVEKRMGGGPWDLVVDAGGGHGLQALLWLAYQAARQAWVVDQRQPKIHPALVAAFESVVSLSSLHYLEVRWQHFQPPPLPARTLVVGVHACGRFGEQLMEWARQHQCPFAVLTCCHDSPDVTFTTHLKAVAREKEIPYFDALDLVRLGRIQGWGWKGELVTLNPRLSPRNNILLGFPPTCPLEREGQIPKDDGGGARCPLAPPCG